MAGLTARFVETVKAIPGKRSEYPDDVIRGLALRVSENGSKSWALRYRLPSGRQRRLTLGGFPALSLAKARDEAIKALGAVASERDPAGEKKAARAKAKRDRAEKPQTVGALWLLYERDVLPGKREATRTYQTWLWENRLKPDLEDQELATLDRPTARVVLRKIGAGSPVTANRAQALLCHMLNVGVEDGYLTANPLAKMKPLYEETSRARVLSDAELRVLWAMFDQAPGRVDISVGTAPVEALRLQALTLTRAGEVSGLHASEIERESQAWVIPAERSKSGREHVVPLSTDAWEILLRVFGEKPEEWKGYAFPNVRDAEKPMERRSLTRAMSRITAKTKLTEDAKKPIPRCTPHDFRRTGSTLIASERVGTAPHIVSAVLGHAMAGPKVSSVYNRYEYVAEKRMALQAWADLLREIVTGAKRSVRVVSIATAKAKPK